MILAVTLDMDGHFRVSPLHSRSETIKLLQSIGDGDYWDNEIEPKFNTEVMLYPDDKWQDWVRTFTCRGVMELVEV